MKRYPILVILAFGFSMVVFCSGLDAWLWLWIRSGMSSHNRVTLNVTSSKPYTINERVYGAIVTGRINGTQVEAILSDALGDRRDYRTYAERATALSGDVLVYWNGSVSGSMIQERNSNIVEARFIDNFQWKVWLSAISTIFAISLWILAFRDPGRGPMRLHLPFIIDKTF